MKNMFIFSVILAAAIASAGCTSMCSMCGGKESSDSSAMGKMTCPACGMPKGQCKCSMMTKPMAEINTAALKSLIDSGVELTLVDARTGKFDDGRRISNALNLSPEAEVEEIQRVLKSKDAMIVSYCANLKCPASRQLASRLTALGYKHVLEYPQGIEGWVNEGNAITQGAKQK